MLQTLEFAAMLGLVLLGLGFIIFMHELGHFLVAKWVGIRCDQFAVGFGKAAWSYRKGMGIRRGSTEPEYYQRIADFLNGDAPKDPDFRSRYNILSAIEPVPIKSLEDLARIDYRLLEAATQELGLSETEYRLNVLPLGGYVKMLGQEDMNPNATSENPRAYNRKPIAARMAVISAGVIMNLIIAVPFLTAAPMVGVPMIPVVVGSIPTDSPAASVVAKDNPDIVGIKPGDEIILIDGVKPKDFSDIRMTNALAKAGQPIEYVVKRTLPDGSVTELTFDIVPVKGTAGLMEVGIAPTQSLALFDDSEKQNRTVFDKFVAEYNIEGLALDTTVTTLNGRTLSHAWQIEQLLQTGPDHLVITTDQNDQPITIPVATRLQIHEPENDDKPHAHLLGLQPAIAINLVAEGKPAHGILKIGDVVAATNGQAWPNSKQMANAIKSTTGDVRITVIRDGQSLDLTIPRDSDEMIGIGMGPTTRTNHILAISPDSPFADANLAPGTAINTINGKPIDNFTDIRRALTTAGPGNVKLDVTEPLLGGTFNTVTAELTADHLAPLQTLAWTTPLTALLQPNEVMFQTNNPAEALAYGAHKSKQFLVQTYVMLARLFQGSVPTDKLAGPIGMGFMGKRFVEKGFGYFLYFLGLISINLAVINFLPLPIVDGGHFVLLILEKIRGKPLPEPVMNAITVAGLALLAFVFIYVTKNDLFVNLQHYLG